MFLCFSGSIQINHDKNLQIYVLYQSRKCKICSKWCKRKIYSKLTIKTPLLFFWYPIANVSVGNLNRYTSAGIIIFQLKIMYLILRTEIAFCWGSKRIINWQIGETDPVTLLHLRWSALWQWGGIESIEGGVGRSIQNLCRVHIIMNNSINQALRTCRWILAQSQ